MNCHTVGAIQVYLRTLSSSFSSQALSDVEKIARFTKFEKKISERIASLAQEHFSNAETACHIQTKWIALVQRLHTHSVPCLSFSDLASSLRSMIDILETMRIQHVKNIPSPTTARLDYSLFREEEVEALFADAHSREVVAMQKRHPHLFEAAHHLTLRVLDDVYGEHVRESLTSGLFAQEQFLLLLLLDGLLSGARLRKIEIFRHITPEEVRRLREVKKTLTTEQVTHYFAQEAHQEEFPLHGELMQIVQRSFFKEHAKFATLVAYVKTAYAPSTEQLLYLLLKLDRPQLLDTIRTLTDKRKYDELCCLHMIIVLPRDNPHRQQAKQWLIRYASPEIQATLYRVLELMCHNFPQQAIMLVNELFPDSMEIASIVETVARTRLGSAMVLLSIIDEEHRALCRLRIARFLAHHRPELIMTLAISAPKEEQPHLFSVAIRQQRARLQLVNFLPTEAQSLFLAVYAAEVTVNDLEDVISELRVHWVLEIDFFIALAHHMGDRNDTRSIIMVLRHCREEERSIVLFWHVYGLLKHDIPRSIPLIGSILDAAPLGNALLLLVQTAHVLRAEDAAAIASHLWRCPPQARRRIIETFISKFAGILPRHAFMMAMSDASWTEHYLGCFFSATFDEGKIFTIEDIRAVLALIANYGGGHFRIAIRIKNFFLKKLAFALFDKGDIIGAAQAVNDIQDSVCSYEAIERGVLIAGAPTCFLLLNHLDRRYWEQFAIAVDGSTNHLQNLTFSQNGAISLHEAATLSVALINHQENDALAFHLLEHLLAHQTLEEYFALLPLLDRNYHQIFFTVMRTMPEEKRNIFQHLQRYIDTYHDNPAGILASAMEILTMAMRTEEIGHLIDKAEEWHRDYLRELCLWYAMQQGQPDIALFALEGITNKAHLDGALRAITRFSQLNEAYFPLMTRARAIVGE